jgi:thioesterase domain-containing protein
MGRRKDVWHDIIMPHTRHHNGASQIDRSLAALWNNNEAIASRYVPKSYPGRIDQFVPMKNYFTMTKSNASWEDVARGGVDVHKLPVYPAGMLMEPYVQQLAEELRKRIEQALANPPREPLELATV